MVTFDTSQSSMQTAESRPAEKRPSSRHDPRSGMPSIRDADAVSEVEFHAVAAYFGMLRSFIKHSRTAAKHFGITPQQYDALLEICSCSDHADITVGGLAKRLNIKHNTVVMIINRLCHKGYVIRVQSQRDHRLVHLQLTDAGSAFLTKLVQDMHREFTGMAAGFARIAGGPL